MKICDIVLDSIWHDPRVRKQIEEYCKNNIEVVAIGCMDDRYNEEKIKSLPCKTVLINTCVNCKNLIVKIISKLKWRIEMKNAILLEKPDVIHANDLDALVCCYKVVRKLKCKLIYDSHEIFLENISISKIHKFIYKYYERKLIKKVDKFICVSNAAADYFKSIYPCIDPLVITNCLSKELRPNFLEKNEKFEILNHGKFYEGRGYELMLDTAEILKGEDNIVFALRGFGKLEKSLKDKAESLNLKNVKFYDPVDVKSLVEYAAKSMVGVAITEPICLNFEFSVSNKLFEYCSAGLPVIMSDIPEHRFINEKYKIGIILERNTPEVFKDAVLALYNDKKLYDFYAQNALKLVEEVNWENEFNKIIKIEREWCNEF